MRVARRSWRRPSASSSSTAMRARRSARSRTRSACRRRRSTCISRRRARSCTRSAAAPSRALLAANAAVITTEAGAGRGRLRQMMEPMSTSASSNPNAYRLIYLTRPIEARDGAETAAQKLGAELFRSFEAVVEEVQAAGPPAAAMPAPRPRPCGPGSHGVVSLMITKPYFDWVDREVLTRTMLDALFVGPAQALRRSAGLVGRVGLGPAGRRARCRTRVVSGAEPPFRRACRLPCSPSPASCSCASR